MPAAMMLHLFMSVYIVAFEQFTYIGLRVGCCGQMVVYDFQPKILKRRGAKRLKELLIGKSLNIVNDTKDLIHRVGGVVVNQIVHEGYGYKINGVVPEHRPLKSICMCFTFNV